MGPRAVMLADARMEGAPAALTRLHTHPSAGAAAVEAPPAPAAAAAEAPAAPAAAVGSSSCHVSVCTTPLNTSPLTGTDVYPP